MYITNAIFLAMGFIPVLIEAGFAGLIYEVALTFVSNEVKSKPLPPVGVRGPVIERRVKYQKFLSRNIGLLSRGSLTFKHRLML